MILTFIKLECGTRFSLFGLKKLFGYVSLVQFLKTITPLTGPHPFSGYSRKHKNYVQNSKSLRSSIRRRSEYLSILQSPWRIKELLNRQWIEIEPDSNPEGSSSFSAFILHFLFPSPSCPHLFLPQEKTWKSWVRAKEWSWPSLNVNENKIISKSGNRLEGFSIKSTNVIAHSSSIDPSSFLED